MEIKYIGLYSVDFSIINNGISEHKKDPGIPNDFPYKDQILAEVAEERRRARLYFYLQHCAFYL